MKFLALIVVLAISLNVVTACTPSTNGMCNPDLLQCCGLQLKSDLGLSNCYGILAFEPECHRQEIENMYINGISGLMKVCDSFNKYYECLGSARRDCTSISYHVKAGLRLPDAVKVVSMYKQFGFACGAGFEGFANNDACMSQIFATKQTQINSTLNNTPDVSTHCLITAPATLRVLGGGVNTQDNPEELYYTTATCNAPKNENSLSCVAKLNQYLTADSCTDDDEKPIACIPLDINNLNSIVQYSPPNSIVFVVTNMAVSSITGDIVEDIIATSIARRIQINVLVYNNTGFQADDPSLATLSNIAAATLGQYILPSIENGNEQYAMITANNRNSVSFPVYCASFSYANFACGSDIAPEKTGERSFIIVAENSNDTNVTKSSVDNLFRNKNSFFYQLIDPLTLVPSSRYSNFLAVLTNGETYQIKQLFVLFVQSYTQYGSDVYQYMNDLAIASGGIAVRLDNYDELHTFFTLYFPTLIANDIVAKAYSSDTKPGIALNNVYLQEQKYYLLLTNEDSSEDGPVNDGAFRPVIYSTTPFNSSSQISITYSDPANPAKPIYNGSIIPVEGCEEFKWTTNYDWICSVSGGLYHVKIDSPSNSVTRTFPITCLGPDAGGCLNGGHEEGGVCSCPLEWSGNSCQTPNCLNGGTVTTADTCACNPEFTGSFCESYGDDISPRIVESTTNSMHLLDALKNRNSTAVSPSTSPADSDMYAALKLALDNQLTNRALFVVYTSNADVSVNSDFLIRLATRRAEVRVLSVAGTESQNSLALSLVGNGIPFAVKESTNFQKTAYGFNDPKDNPNGANEMVNSGVSFNEVNLLHIYSTPFDEIAPSNPGNFPYLSIKEILGNGTLSAPTTLLFTRKSSTGCFFKYFTTLDVCSQSGTVGYQVQDGSTVCQGPHRTSSPNKDCDCDSNWGGIDCTEPVCANGVRDMSICRCPVDFYGLRCEQSFGLTSTTTAGPSTSAASTSSSTQPASSSSPSQTTNSASSSSPSQTTTSSVLSTTSTPAQQEVRAVAFIIDMLGNDDYAFNQTFMSMAQYYKLFKYTHYVMIIGNLNVANEHSSNITFQQYPNETSILAKNDIFFSYRSTETGGSNVSLSIVYSPFAKDADPAVPGNLTRFSPNITSTRDYYGGLVAMKNETSANAHVVLPDKPPTASCVYSLQSNVRVAIDRSLPSSADIETALSSFLSKFKVGFNFIENDEARGQVTTNYLNYLKLGTDNAYHFVVPFYDVTDKDNDLYYQILASQPKGADYYLLPNAATATDIQKDVIDILYDKICQRKELQESMRMLGGRSMILRRGARIWMRWFVSRRMRCSKCRRKEQHFVSRKNVTMRLLTERLLSSTIFCSSIATIIVDVWQWSHSPEFTSTAWKFWRC
ncbi:Protein CBG14645 [Caenorhabditis briggsae]|uniref:Protein CBG14645 n=1 Tax=Caenorhabditis briggsae TaxID=6238 RepID=A8XKC9_CAEBR|nr:Protein CBG14645 [Caenorhabditis briggsae]CAP33103.1 Protein CBG14645 [Caenorhabditis briggsae]